jgi:hypothetical protein
MYERPPVVALRDYLAAIASHPSLGEEAQTEELHKRVCSVVDELKAAGWPPERVIVAVKQVAEGVGMHPSRSVLSATSPLGAKDATLVKMVRWCIEEYYGVDIPPTPS